MAKPACRATGPRTRLVPVRSNVEACVLNIGKLSPGAAQYYVGEIASSAEDYYMGHGEAAGRWVGSLPRARRSASVN